MNPPPEQGGKRPPEAAGCDTRARRLAVQRATRPIMVVRTVAFTCAAVVAVILSASLDDGLGRWLAWLRPPSTDAVSPFAFVQGILLLAACTGFLILAAYALVSSWRPSR